jgi:hypothetical protein
MDGKSELCIKLDFAKESAPKADFLLSNFLFPLYIIHDLPAGRQVHYSLLKLPRPEQPL